jgi:hypothetical protein
MNGFFKVCKRMDSAEFSAMSIASTLIFLFVVSGYIASASMP